MFSKLALALILVLTVTMAGAAAGAIKDAMHSVQINQERK